MTDPGVGSSALFGSSALTIFVHASCRTLLLPFLKIRVVIEGQRRLRELGQRSGIRISFEAGKNREDPRGADRSNYFRSENEAKQPTEK